MAETGVHDAVKRVFTMTEIPHYALLRLCDKYGEGRVEAVCQSALAFDVVDVSRITRMLKIAAVPTVPEPPMKAKVVQLPLPRFARPEEHFATRPSASKKEGV